MTFLGCVLSLLHTKASIFPSSSAPGHVTTSEEKTLSCLHPQLTAARGKCGARVRNKDYNAPPSPRCGGLLKNVKIPPTTLSLFVHSGKQFLLQVVCLTPCAHNRVTTPTRGWWKITSIEATGEPTPSVMYCIIRPYSASSPADLCVSYMYDSLTKKRKKKVPYSRCER